MSHKSPFEPDGELCHSFMQRRLASLHRLTWAFVIVPKSQMAIRVKCMRAARTGECIFAQSRISHRKSTKIACVGDLCAIHANIKGWWVYTFAQACLSLRQSTKISCWLLWRFVCHSCEQRRLVSLHSLAWAFVRIPKSHVLAQMAICVSFMGAAKTG